MLHTMEMAQIKGIALKTERTLQYSPFNKLRTL